MVKKKGKISEELEIGIKMLESAINNLKEGKNNSQAEIDPGTKRMLIVSHIDYRDGEDGKRHSLPLFYEIRYSVVINLRAAAKYAGVDVRTIQRWRDDGAILCLQVDNKPYFPIAYLKEYCERMGRKVNE